MVNESRYQPDLGLNLGKLKVILGLFVDQTSKADVN